jgi:hypothetical protein
LWPVVSKTGTGAKLAAATTPEQLNDVFTMLINGTVDVFNKIGKFVKAGQAAISTPTA